MTYNELYPNSLSNGSGLLFDLSINLNNPWHGLSDEDKKSIERAYSIRSGDKTVYSKFEEIESSERCQLIHSIYNEIWTKYWNLYLMQYDPLSAYIVDERGSRDKNVDTFRDTKYGKTESHNSSDTGTVTNVDSINSGSDSFVNGFNSIDKVPSDSSTSTETNNSTETRNLSDSTNISNSGNDTIEGTDVENEEYVVMKKGNIGYSTPQKLLSGEFELWRDSFFDKVFKDIDKLIMIKIYT